MVETGPGRVLIAGNVYAIDRPNVTQKLLLTTNRFIYS